MEIGAALLEPLNSSLGASPLQIRNFVYRVQQAYRDNPFHNKMHAALTTHSFMCLLKMTTIYRSEKFTRQDSAVALIAALGHDAGHPGRTNSFFTNSFQPLSLLFNDRSVLENFHAAVMFRIMQAYARHMCGGRSNSKTDQVARFSGGLPQRTLALFESGSSTSLWQPTWLSISSYCQNSVCAKKQVDSIIWGIQMICGTVVNLLPPDPQTG